MEIEDQVAGTFLEGADVIGVDAPTGLGLDELRARPSTPSSRSVPTAADRDRPRLWVDRSFAAQGFGHRRDRHARRRQRFTSTTSLLLMDGHRSARVRVRALQSHQRPFQSVGPWSPAGRQPDRHQPRPGAPGPRPGPARTMGADPSGRRIAADPGLPRPRRVPAGRPPALRRLGRVPGAAAGARDRCPPPGGGRAVSGCTCRSSCHSCPATATSSGRAAGPRPSAAARSSTSPRSSRHPRPGRRARSSGSSRSGAGWTSTNWNGSPALAGRPTVGERWVVAPGALAATKAAVIEACRDAGDHGLDMAALSERQRAVLPLLVG